MQNSPPLAAKTTVRAFLQSQIDAKTEKERKQLEKAREDADHAKVSDLLEKVAEVKAKFQTDIWLQNASERMAKQLSFGTHISKGIHPDAKGDNISFLPQTKPAKCIVGTHSIQSNLIDANGNAAALPLAAFFDFQVSDNVKIRDLILGDNPDFINSLATDIDTAKAYHLSFKEALQNQIDEPMTHERNKQMLWAINPYSTDNIDALEYTAIVPLYPSVFTHELYQRINELRYSETNKTARENRFKVNAEKTPYVSMFDLATVQLGGTKPQNVSLLMSKQGGRNYLLPSLPPKIAWSYSFNLSKFSKSIFASKSLEYHVHNAIEAIYNVVKSERNNVFVRNDRKEAVDAVLHVLFSIANEIRTNQPAGWSKDFQLDMAEKLWLDPRRAELPDEEEFKQQREVSDWNQTIITNFANWLNHLLKTEFKHIKHDFSQPEHNEWEREIEDMQKVYECAGKGVFL